MLAVPRAAKRALVVRLWWRPPRPSRRTDPGSLAVPSQGQNAHSPSPGGPGPRATSEPAVRLWSPDLPTVEGSSFCYTGPEPRMEYYQEALEMFEKGLEKE